MVPLRTKRQSSQYHNGPRVALLSAGGGVREPHVADTTFDSVAAVRQLQTVTDAGHVATTSLPFVTACDTLS